MAGPKGSKYFDVFLDYRFSLRSKSDKGKVDDAIIVLLQEIDNQGSLKKAALKCELSYRKAWGDIKNAEDFFGFELIKTVRGGKDGGLSELTVNGQQLVNAFSELNSEFDQAGNRIIKDFFHKLNRSEKETPE